MKIVQRMLLVFLVVLVFMGGTTWIYGKNKNRLQEQWGNIHAERLLQNICHTGYCTYEDYMVCFLAMSYCGMDSEIRIEEYRKEWDVDGKCYYYLISWEEIRGCFLEQSTYEFSGNSVIRIVVRGEDFPDIELWKERKNDS